MANNQATLRDPFDSTGTQFAEEAPPRKDTPFTAFERDSGTHARWVSLLQARLVTMRIENDGTKSYEDTARLRGRIAEIKELLALAGAN